MNPTNYNTTKGITDIWVTNQFLNLRPAPHKRSIPDTVNPGQKSRCQGEVYQREAKNALQDGQC